MHKTPLSNMITCMAANFKLVYCCGPCCCVPLYYDCILYTVPSGTRHWMDSTFYEVFILTNQPTNTSIRNLFFISSESFRTNDGTLVDLVEDITFTLNSSCPYFYFDEMNKTEVVFENYFDLYVPDTIEVVELFLAEPIPPDDYEMQVIVTSSGIVLETRDIVVHVTRDPVCLKPPCPIQGNK